MCERVSAAELFDFDPEFSVNGEAIPGATGLLVVFALATLGVVRPGEPVRPITSVATVGGFLGGVSAAIAFETLVGRAEHVTGAAWRLRERLEESVYVVGYATLLGYSYPRLTWNLGARVLGTTGYPLGRPVTPVPGLLTAALYVVLVFPVSLLVYRWRLRRRGGGPLARRHLLALAGAHAVYAVWLFLTVGFAGVVWFAFIPNAS